MSVRWMRTVQIANGKYLEAIGWAKEVSAYAEKKYGTPPISVWLDAFGEFNTVRWTIDYPDLASVEKVQAQLMTDQAYWQLIDKAFKAQLFVDGSGYDTISRQV